MRRREPRSRSSRLLLLFLLAALSPARSQTTESEAEPRTTAGSYSFRISSRTFDAPLFGSRTTAIYRLFGTQAFANGSRLTAFLDSGFPNFQTDWGISLEELSYGKGQLAIQAGDFLHERLLPIGHNPVSRDLYPLQGLDLGFRHERTVWGVFAGRAKRFRGLPGREVEAPVLFGARVLRRKGLNHFGASVTGVERPTFVDQRSESQVAILGLQYYREFSPWTRLFSEASTSDEGRLGARLGLRHRFLRGELVTGAFTFAEELPFVDPIYRPGESGLELYGNYRLSNSLSLFGHVDYFRDEAVDERSDVRADVGLGWSAPGDGPYFSLRYSRNEVTLESTSIAERDNVVDRFYLQMSKSTVKSFFDFSVEHLIRSTEGADRSQALLTLSRMLTDGSLFDASVVAQRQGDSDYGMTTEASIERPIRRRYHYLLGLGGAFLDRGGSRSGEGALRVGISRRAVKNGLSGRVELVLPFSIGLDRSQLGGRQLRFEVGHRFSWNSLTELKAAFAPVLARNSLGAIEGRISGNGRGIAQATIYLNGQPRARSDADGFFRIKRVPVGRVTVSLDLLEFDARVQVVEGPARQVSVRPKATSVVDFELRELSYLQGSLILCVGGEERPVAGAALTLLGEELSYNLSTSALGGFQFGEVEPGLYQLMVDPLTLDPTIEVRTPLVWELDLSGDLGGLLLRLNCP